MVTSMLYVLILPATTPLWRWLGIIFGVVIGKEIFGGTGKNFLNPALTGRAFLYFAYPASLSGDSVWVPVDGYSGATALSLGASQGHQAFAAEGITWWNSFMGFIEGSMGEVSTFAILIGLAFLLTTKTPTGEWSQGMAGMVAFLVCLTDWLGLNPMFAALVLHL